jgi:hypothetical protein
MEIQRRLVKSLRRIRTSSLLWSNASAPWGFRVAKRLSEHERRKTEWATEEEDFFSKRFFIWPRTITISVLS